MYRKLKSLGNGAERQNRIFFFPIEGESESVRFRADRRPRSDFRVHVHAGPSRDHGLRAGGHRARPPPQDEGNVERILLRCRNTTFLNVVMCTETDQNTTDVHCIAQREPTPNLPSTQLQMTKLRVVEPTTDLTRVSEGIAQLEIMLNDVIKVSG